jgi:hypothetical protein
LKDLDKIDPVVRENVTFIPCRRGTEVLSHALVSSIAIDAHAAKNHEDEAINLRLTAGTRVRAEAKGKTKK